MAEITSIEQVLKQPRAKAAWDKLAGREPKFVRILTYWLLAAANASDKPVRRNQQQRRQATQLARDARRLATIIESATQSPPMPFAFESSDVSTILELPANLRKYADLWENVLSWGGAPEPSPRSMAISGLLDVVKWGTGRYHYKEIAELLAAADLAYGRTGQDIRWDVTNLKQLQYRSHKRREELGKGLDAW